MREIKFRGKRIDNAEWIYGYYVNCPSGQHRIYLQPFEGASANTYFVVHPESVGQYTGLKESQEKEVYEDDILQDDEATYRVIWCDNRFAWDLLRLQDQNHIGGYGCYSSDFFMDFVSNSIKIGTAYENP